MGPHGAFGGKVREGGCCLVPHGGGGVRGQEKLTAQLVGARNVAHFNYYRTESSWGPTDCQGQCQDPRTAQRTRPTRAPPSPNPPSGAEHRHGRPVTMKGGECQDGKVRAPGVSSEGGPPRLGSLGKLLV